MNALAIVMMILSLLVIWGGLAASIVYLSRHPSRELDVPEETSETPAQNP